MNICFLLKHYLKLEMKNSRRILRMIVDENICRIFKSGYR